MFLKTAKFKKLLKEAYTGSGLHIGNTGDGTFLRGSYWMMWIKGGCIPKEKLAAIIELIGDLPETGTGFSATKDGQQYELQLENQMHVMEEAKKCMFNMDVTKILLENIHGNHWRVLQHRLTRKIRMISERFIEMIDESSVDQNNGHTMPEGSVCGNLPGVFWSNNIMAMYVMPRSEDGIKNLISHLETIDINEVENNEWTDVSETETEEEKEEA